MENEAEIRLLLAAMEHLDAREREIISLRYGIGQKDGKELTQKEVADRLGISQSYISRLEKKIMVRLKKEMQRN
jgi:RNA polymerase sporulation-specific sigma factor